MKNAGTLDLARAAIAKRRAPVQIAPSKYLPGVPRQVHAAGGVITKGDGGGITAYHGSPHDFDAFDINQIGTGEGAQAYGHGLYFADNEDVARQYRNMVSKDKGAFDIINTKTGKRITEETPGYDTIYNAMKSYGSDFRSGDKSHFIENWKRWSDHHEKNTIPEYEAHGGLGDEVSRMKKQVLDWRAAAELMPYAKMRPRGHMYKVNLNVGPHELLDWDAPLSQQPAWQKVRQHWDNTKGDPDIIADRLGLDENSTGQDLHRALSGPNQINAAIALSEAGIKGIRYLDAGSRGYTGEPTYNYVMFHHDPVKIVDKYAYGGAITKADGGTVEGAETVARMLREGRASEITNEHLDAADPQHLWKLYETGQTGMDMPMDAKSRAARAKELGFTSKEFHGTTTGGEMRYPSPNYGSGSREGIGFVTSSNPHVASSYADPKFGSVFPMLNRDQNLANIDAKGEVWSGIPEEAEVALPGGAKTTVGRYASGRADMGGVHDTNQIARGARIEGDGGVRISNLLDRSIHVPDDRNDPSLRTEFQQKSSVPSDVTFRHDTRGIRSIFARFDPRLAHLSHLNASTGGKMENPVDLNFERARKNVASGDLPQHVQNTFARLAERNRAQLAAHQEAMQAGAFDDTQIGDEYRAPAGTTFKITNHFMMPADRWGGREPPSMVYQGHVPMVSTVYTDPKMKGFDMNRAVEHVKQMERIGGPLRVVKAGGGAADGYVPQKTVKAYKLFRTKGDGKLYSLFVHADNPVETGKWLEAEEGPQGKTQGKVKSKIGDLAHRPGWHAGDLPIATHIGGKSDPSLNKPDYRPDNHVWAEVEIAADHDWQSEADSRGRGVKAHITDQVPLRGFYRYKTNPNMTGNWLIGGHMKVNRVLSDDEVKAINDAAGVADLPRLSRVAKAGGGGTGDNGDAPVNLGVHRFHRQLNSDVQSTMNDMVDAHQKALKAGVFDGYEVGDKLQGQVGGPLTVKARYMAKWRPGGVSDKTIQRMGQIPTLMDHNGVTYHPMLRLTGADGSEGDYPLDAVRGYPKFTGLRVVKKNGGGVKLYSKAAQIIRGLAKPEDNAEEMVRIALEKGAKKAELQHADVAPGMASRDQVADYIEAVQPRIGVQKLGSHDAGLTDEERDELGYLKSMMPHRISVENIQRIIELENKKSSSAKYEEYQLPGGENYREHVLTLDSHSHNDPYYARNHWGKMKNPLAHIRMSDRLVPPVISSRGWADAHNRMMEAIGVTDRNSIGAGAPDAAVAKGAITPDEARAIAVNYGWTGSKHYKPRKILHVEELQSDWNSDARRKGFRTGTEQEDYDNFVKDMRQKAVEQSGASPMVKAALEKKYSEMEPHTLARKMGMIEQHQELYRRAKFPGPPQAPYVNPKSDDWAELALKHVLHEAAQGGYDGITFTPDAEQSKRWRGTDFNGMYDKKFPGIAARLVKQHDPSINPSTMQITQGVQGPMIPLTEQARRGILENGFSSFKKGGYVR